MTTVWTTVNVTNDVTTDAPEEEDLAGGKLYSILVPAVWGCLVIVGSLGNALVIYTLVRHGDKNATNYFVINLAISDFAFLVIVVPFTATLYALPEWIFGEGMCKITMYMIYVTLHATCLTLTAMTIDRYCAIVYAVKSMTWRTTKASVVVCLVVWAVSFIISLPFAIYFKLVETDDHGLKMYCMEQWPDPKNVWNQASIISVVTTTYVVPMSVILFCYARILKVLWRNKMTTSNRRDGCQTNGVSSKKARIQEKRRKRVTKMVASVVLVFATFWLPIHVINLWIKLDSNFPRTIIMYDFKIFAHTLSYANSVVDPFVYAFLSDGFRKAFRKSFPSIAQRYKICGGTTAVEEATSVVQTEKDPNTRVTTYNNVACNTEERRLIQTDL